MKLSTTVKNVETRLAPFEAYLALREEVEGESYFLESIEGTRKTARYSFIGIEPIFSFSSKGKHVKYFGPAGEGNGKVESPYNFLKEKFTDYSVEPLQSLPFSGGLVGYFGYDIAREFEKLPEKLPDDIGLPDARFIIASQVLCFDHISGKTTLVSHNSQVGAAKKVEKLLLMPPQAAGSFSMSKPASNFRITEFLSAVEKTKQHINDGDIFQAVISRRESASYKGDEAAIYAALRRVNPSPYMYFLDFEETKLVGSSPEMLVRLEERTLTTRPIAGTRARSPDVEEDELLKVSLLLDEKERAEHVMLVDLHRSDLGRVCEYGSVKVDSLMGIEKYSHVQHLVSNVAGQLAKGKDAFDALKACFPAGTVTGAPKIRAMEIIESLEKARRGPYAGVAGYFGFSGNMDFAINIRSVYTKGRKAYFQAGAGIVADSVAEAEYAETENKLKGVVDALRGGEK